MDYKNIGQSYQSVYIFGIYVLFWVHQSDSLLPERVEKQFWKNAEKRMPHVDCILYFGHRLCSIGRGKIFRWKFVAEVVMLKKYPGWSEFLVSFCSSITGGDFSVSDHKTDEYDNVFGVACISCIACYIPYERIHNSWLALLTGSRDYITFPVLQYGVFLRLEFWFAKGDQMESPDTAADNNCRNPMPDYCFENRFLPERFPPSVWFICGDLYWYMDII